MKGITEEILSAVRSRIATEENIDDLKAMKIISEEIFKRQELADTEVEDIRLISRNIFYRTRSRLGILKPLVDEQEITEIMVNGPDTIFVERKGRVSKTPLAFDSLGELEEIMQNIASGVHREINELNPIVDARLSDGSRVNGVYKNIAVNGPILTIRKFSERCMSMKDLTDNGTITDEGSFLLQALTCCGYNIFVSGGTSSGKTTMLNALSQFIPSYERVIVIEDSAELKLGFIDNLVRMECRQGNTYGKGKITMSQLIKTSLRMRPDRIIVGEVRGEEVLDMLQAMNTGHAGSMSTGHGNSVEGMLRRLEAMYMMAMPLDIEAVRAQIAEGIDIMVHVEKRKSKRMVTEISELTGYKDGSFQINRIMESDGRGVLAFTGRSLTKCEKLMRGDELYFDRLQEFGVIS